MRSGILMLHTHYTVNAGFLPIVTQLQNESEVGKFATLTESIF